MQLWHTTKTNIFGYTNCPTAVVRKNKTKRMFKIYKSQYTLRYNILTVKLQSVIREMQSGLKTLRLSVLEL